MHVQGRRTVSEAFYSLISFNYVEIRWRHRTGGGRRCGELAANQPPDRGSPGPGHGWSSGAEAAAAGHPRPPGQELRRAAAGCSLPPLRRRRGGSGPPALPPRGLRAPAPRTAASAGAAGNSGRTMARPAPPRRLTAAPPRRTRPPRRRPSSGGGGGAAGSLRGRQRGTPRQEKLDRAAEWQGERGRGQGGTAPSHRAAASPRLGPGAARGPGRPPLLLPLRALRRLRPPFWERGTRPATPSPPGRSRRRHPAAALRRAASRPQPAPGSGPGSHRAGAARPARMLRGAEPFRAERRWGEGRRGGRPCALSWGRQGGGGGWLKERDVRQLKAGRGGEASAVAVARPAQERCEGLGRPGPLRQRLLPPAGGRGKARPRDLSGRAASESWVDPARRVTWMKFLCGHFKLQSVGVCLGPCFNSKIIAEVIFTYTDADSHYFSRHGMCLPFRTSKGKIRWTLGQCRRQQ